MPIPDYEASLSGEALPSPPPQQENASADNEADANTPKAVWPVAILALIVAAFFLGQQQGKSSGVSVPSGSNDAPVIQQRPRLHISGPVNTKIKVGDRFDQIDASGTAELNVDPDEPVVVQIRPDTSPRVPLHTQGQWDTKADVEVDRTRAVTLTKPHDRNRENTV